jgi:hypothetical protein
VLRGEFVFVQQSAEPITTAKAIESQRFNHRRLFIGPRWRLRERRPLGEGAVRPPRSKLQPGEPGMANVIDPDRGRRRDLLGGLIREYRLAA